MDERELERLLAQAGAEEFRPGREVLAATRRRLYGSPLLETGVMASLVAQALVWAAVVAAFLSPGLSGQTRLGFGLCCLSLWGGIVIVVVAARRSIAPFLQRLDARLRGAC